jgi:hypothetical protein
MTTAELARRLLAQPRSLYELHVAEAKTGKAIKKLPTLKHRDEKILWLDP